VLLTGQSENPAEVRTLLEMHHAAAWRWAVFCMKGDRSRGEDVLHDVYVKILNGEARFGGHSSFQTWLFGVIRWNAVASRRKNSWLSLIMEPINQGLPDAPSAQEFFSPTLSSVLPLLSPQQRQLAMLVFEHDFTLEEAAKAMGLTVGTARQHYARAKEKLRAALRKGTRDE
jgi:RNA polymerase sigma-70 factor (ECF subfamily)